MFTDRERETREIFHQLNYSPNAPKGNKGQVELRRLGLLGLLFVCKGPRTRANYYI